MRTILDAARLPTARRYGLGAVILLVVIAASVALGLWAVIPSSRAIGRAMEDRRYRDVVDLATTR